MDNFFGAYDEDTLTDNTKIQGQLDTIIATTIFERAIPFKFPIKIKSREVSKYDKNIVNIFIIG